MDIYTYVVILKHSDVLKNTFSSSISLKHAICYIQTGIWDIFSVIENQKKGLN